MGGVQQIFERAGRIIGNFHHHAQREMIVDQRLPNIQNVDAKLGQDTHELGR